jgi:hypothetical protein
MGAAPRTASMTPSFELHCWDTGDGPHIPPATVQHHLRDIVPVSTTTLGRVARAHPVPAIIKELSGKQSVRVVAWARSVLSIRPMLVVVLNAVPHRSPAFVGLAFDVGFSCFPLVVERVELLLLAVLGRDPSIDGAAQAPFGILGLHVAASSLGKKPAMFDLLACCRSARCSRSLFASRSARSAITSSTDPALSDRVVNSGDARLRRPRVDASPSRRSTHFAFRLAAHCLREWRDVGLRYAGVGGCAVFGGRAPFDAVDRTALFVRPIDCRPQAALAQSSQRGACRVRKPTRHNDQLVDARTAILLKQFDDRASFVRPAERMTAGGAVPSSPTDERSQEPNALLRTIAPSRRSLASRRRRLPALVLSSHRSRSYSPLRRSVSAHRTARHRHRAARQALPLSP